MIEERQHGASTPGAVINLLNTIVGAGILAMPFAFKGIGMVSGICLQVIFCLCAQHSARLLLASYKLTSIRSYEGIATAALGRAGFVIYNLACFTNGAGSCLGYMVVVGDMVPPLLAELGFECEREWVIVLVAIFIMFPLSAQSDLSALQYASGVAILIYVVFTSTLLALYVRGPHMPLDPQPALFKPGAGGWLRAISLTAFSFACMPAIFPIYQELANPTMPRITRIATMAINIAALLYAITGAAAYGYFGEAVLGDVLLDLATFNALYYKLLRLGIGFSVSLSYPVLQYTARRSLDQLMFGSTEGNAPRMRLMLETVAIVSVTLVLALYFTQIEVVLAYCGAVASTVTLLTFPPLTYVCLSPDSLWQKCGEILYFAAGVVIGTLGLINTIMQNT